MEFIDKIREGWGITRYEMHKRLGLETPQAYYSLIRSKDRIKLSNLIKLRKTLGISDSELLDLLEAELQKNEKDKGVSQ